MTAALFAGVAITLVLWIRVHQYLERPRLNRRQHRQIEIHQSDNWLDGKLTPKPKMLKFRNIMRSIGTKVLGITRFSSELNQYRVGVITTIAIFGMFIHFWVALIGWIGGIFFIWWSARTTRERRNRKIAREVPFVVDIVRIAVDSGCNVMHALEYVVRESELEFDGLLPEIAETTKRIRCGERVVDALNELGKRCGHEVAMFTSALVSCEMYGSPLTSALQQLSFEVRLDQSRRLDQAARRLSVTLLFPLAGCIFPAFVLLTVVPLLAGSLDWLAISFQ